MTKGLIHVIQLIVMVLGLRLLKRVRSNRKNNTKEVFHNILHFQIKRTKENFYGREKHENFAVQKMIKTFALSLHNKTRK
jgi:hypothetical protein